MSIRIAIATLRRGGTIRKGNYRIRASEHDRWWVGVGKPAGELTVSFGRLRVICRPAHLPDKNADGHFSEGLYDFVAQRLRSRDER